MNRLERYLVIVTNLSILAGLLLVALELRQNRQAIDLQYGMAISQVNSQLFMALATDADLAGLVSKASVGDIDQFTQTDHLRVRNWLFARLEPTLSFYWLRDSDFIEHDDWCNGMRIFERFYAIPYYRKVIDDSITYAKAIDVEAQARCHGKGDA
jgi:hypothetical protein